jgi:hypothetical protein
MSDQYRYENLSKEDLQRAKEMMLNFQDPKTGDRLVPSRIDRLLFSEDSPEIFNSYSIKDREKFFVKTNASGSLGDIIRKRIETAPDEKPDDLRSIIRNRIAGVEKAEKDAITKEQQTLAAAVPQVDASGRVVSVPATPAPKRSLTDYVKGTGETVAALGSQAVVAPVAAGAQLLSDVVSGRTFRGEGPTPGQPLFGQIMKEATYQPKTETGQAIMAGLGKVFEESKLPPVPAGGRTVPIPVLPPAIQPKVKPKVSAEEYQKTRAIIEGVPYQTQQQIQAAASKTGAPGSVGAAGVDVQTQRLERLKELPFPIVAEKSQITRDPADVRFARETTKDPVLGKGFQERYAEQNELLQKNLDFFAEQTGSEKLGLPQADFAKGLVDVVDVNKKQRKQQVTDAYKVAQDAGETAELVDIKPLQNWVKDNRSSAKNAPVIQTIESEIKRLSKDGKISLNDLEEIRKTTNDVYDASPTNARFGGRAIKVIDQMTEGKGGDLYKQARALSRAYKTEFQDTPAVAKITAMKRGTTQRQVALEDLVDNVMLKGTGEDVRQLFASLERMGPEGQAMINDLRGYVAEAIKNQATKGVQRDINGKPYLETKTLDTIIKNLDKSKKLEFLFGKKGAEQYRTINEAVKDLQTIPKETTNPSGTAAQILAGLAEMGGQYAMTGIPVPLLSLAKKGVDIRQQQKQMKKIREFLDYGNKKD